jgi:hypothetical protein
MTIDRRTKTRHDVRLVCHVGPGHVLSKAVAGIVENMSRGGMLMRWEEPVPVPNPGSSLVVDINLPENSEFGSRAMRCRTEVIRVTSRNGRRPMVALRIEQIRFVQKAAARRAALMTLPALSRSVN